MKRMLILVSVFGSLPTVIYFKKLKWKIILFIGVCTASIIGTCIYFVAGVSATSDPIKIYDCSGNVDTLVRRLNELTQVNKSLSFKSTDTTGTEETGHDYYFTLYWVTPHSDTIEYSINISKTNHQFNKNKTVIELVEAINLTHLSGGYTSTSKGIQPLVAIFDSNIISHLTHDNR